jgi:hypothetical protein
MEKYLTLARDASASGDRIAAENFYQHAEHYYRILNANNQDRQQQQSSSAPKQPNGKDANGSAEAATAGSASESKPETPPDGSEQPPV